MGQSLTDITRSSLVFGITFIGVMIMGKGTPAQGKHNKFKTHIPCRRCGKRAYHVRKGVCASCGYGKTATIRSYNWAKLRN